MIIAQRLIVYGRVQGVGFRPATCRLATELGLQGYVHNLGGVVEVVVRGEEKVLTTLSNALKALAAPAKVEKLTRERITSKEFKALYQSVSQGRTDFFAVESSIQGTLTQMTADIGICDQCLAELKDKSNRRYGYSFISCAQCGPRYSIMKKLPYDRAHTTMEHMELCPECAQEYSDMTNRRGHGETISCHHCGPQLSGYLKTEPAKEYKALAAVELAKQLLLEGSIIMVKAMGGFNLVCRADQEAVVAKLRDLKHRPTKPFAVMVSSAQLDSFAQVNTLEWELLTSAPCPIVLLEKSGVTKLASNLAPSSHELGVMLPTTGFYDQLCELNIPIVVTSCNHSEVPIIYADSEAVAFYKQHDAVGGLFTYNRDILRPLDDAVVRVIRDDASLKVQMLRRGRGYVPENIQVKQGQGQVLAVGADMEPSYCLGNNDKLDVRQLPCDLAEEASEQAWRSLLKEDCTQLGFKPQVVVSDLHPGYITTALAEEIAQEHGSKHYQVQHHHAHALSVIAEHNLEGKVLAVVFDGTGYGADGTVWGGEFLLCDGLNYKRVAYLEPVTMIGGDESMKQAWKSGLCYLANYNGKTNSSDDRYSAVQAMLANKVNVIQSSSMGRLFDAVAYTLDLADYNSHQGYCGQLLETVSMASKKSTGNLHFECNINKNKELVWSAKPMWEQLLKTKQKDIAACGEAFHDAILDMINRTLNVMLPRYGIRKVVVSGGCFANKVLLEKVVNGIEYWRAKVYFNQQVPPGDGGIALGQAYYGSLKLAEALASEDK